MKQVRSVALWVIGLALGVLGFLQTNGTIAGHYGGWLVGIGGALLVVEHYIQGTTTGTTTTTNDQAGQTSTTVKTP
jgi:hypothetical protein